MSSEFGVCKFCDHISLRCLVKDCLCQECFEIESCSDLLRTVDGFLECFHKSDDASKDRVLMYLYAKYYVFCKGKE